MDNEAIQSRIYHIRGRQAMLDSDLARMYGVPTFRLNEQVRRNRPRFPPDFMFQLSEVEMHSLRSHAALSKRIPSQFAIASKRNIRHRPLAFTEQGVAMLSGVLRSGRAIEVNIAIMRAFVKLRHALLSSRDVARRVEKLEGKVDVHETDIRLILEDVRQLKKKTIPTDPINPKIV